MSDVFISYSHKDGEYAHRLADELRKHWIDVWIDERIDYGEQWPRVIQENLTACRIFLLIMSTDAFNSMWVQNEVSFAQANNKPIFPLLLEGQVWLSMASMQYVDVRNGKMPPERFFSELLLDLNQPVPVSLKKREVRSRTPAGTKRKRWLYTAIPILLCAGVICALSPLAWNWLSQEYPNIAQPTVKKTSVPMIRPSNTPKPAQPRVTDNPEPVAPFYEPSPTSVLSELYGVDPNGQGVSGLWIGLGMPFDMDTLTQIHDDSSDLFLEYECVLVPMNGARVSSYGHPKPLFLEQCLEAIAGNEAPAAVLEIGLFYCFQTNTGRYGFIMPREIDLENGVLADVYVFP